MVTKILWGFFSHEANKVLYFATEACNSLSLKRRSAVNAVSKNANNAENAKLMAKKTNWVDIAITEEGIQIKDSLYAYKKLKGFSIDEHKMGNQLMIESDRIITPLISIPLPSSIEPTTVIQILEGKVPHKEDLKEHPTHRIMEHIGF
jgi:hypothetical protein